MFHGKYNNDERPIKRGEIYYVEKSPNYAVGSETYGARPAIIVSNNIGNRHSDAVEVVYMSTSPKSDMPTHVKIDCGGRKSIAMCEQVHSISKQRLGDFYGAISDREVKEINKALKISLDLDDALGNVMPKAMPQNSEELAKVTMERDMYKKMYDDLMTRIMTK